MQQIKKFPYLAFIVAILFVTGFTFSSAFFTRLNLGTPTVLGEDREDVEKDESKDDEDEKDEEDENKKEEKENEDEDEEEKVKEFKNRTLKSGQKVEDEDEEDETNEIDEKDEDGIEGQGDVDEINKNISKVESRINVLGANGVDVSSFVVMLSEIKDLTNQAEVKLASFPKEAERILESAEHKLDRLKKMVKMTLGDDDEDADEDDDATEEIQELARDVYKLELKLNALSERGMDVSALRLSLSNVKELLGQAKEKAAAGDLAGAEALTEVADKKFETLKHAMDLAFGDDEEDEDGDEAKEYKNEVAQFVHNLKEIGDMDGGIGQQVKVVAEAQNDSASDVEKSINEINGRNGFVKFLIGPKYGSIAEVQKAIVANQTRVEILNGLLGQVTDPTIKQVLQDQIKEFQQENTKLQAFVTESADESSLFGWLVKMFS